MPPNATMTDAISAAYNEKDLTSFSDPDVTTRSINYYGLDAVDPVKHSQLVDVAVVAAKNIMSLMGLGLFNGNVAVKALLDNPKVRQLLFAVSCLPVFSN